MGDTPEASDRYKVRPGVWMAGSDKVAEGYHHNTGTGFFIDIAPKLFGQVVPEDRTLVLGNVTVCVADVVDVVMDPNGRPLPFGPRKGVRILSDDEIPFAVEAALEAIDIRHPLFLGWYLVDEESGKNWPIDDVLKVIGLLGIGSLVAKNTIDN